LGRVRSDWIKPIKANFVGVFATKDRKERKRGDDCGVGLAVVGVGNGALGVLVNPGESEWINPIKANLVGAFAAKDRKERKRGNDRVGLAVVGLRN
jgi:hypothetical protein